MKTAYQAPQVEVIEIELENILCASGGSIEDTTEGINI